MTDATHSTTRMQVSGGLAALYIALVHLLAIPYFLVMVDYADVSDPVQKVSLLARNEASMYWAHILCFQLAAIAVIVVTLAVHRRLVEQSPSAACVAAAVGLTYAALLLGSVMVFNHALTTVVRLYETAPDEAVAVWQAAEPVAMALGGSGGELLGGLWSLLVCWAALRTSALPKALSWFGLVIGAAGILSVVPLLAGLGAVFGLLQIVWFLMLGIVLVRTHEEPVLGTGPGAGRHTVGSD